MTPIEKFVDDAFAVACERIQIQLPQVTKPGNCAGHVPALVEVKQKQLREMILARADAIVEASNLYGVPCDGKAEMAFERSAMQIAGGALAALHGQLTSTQMRINQPLNWAGGYLEREIGSTQRSAVNEGLLGLRRQRITFQKAHSRSSACLDVEVGTDSGDRMEHQAGAGTCPGTREDRLQSFLREHPGVTLADIRYSASVHKPDFLRWRKEKLPPTSVMAQRIEGVFAGRRRLIKKPQERPAD